jgi:hypothetical protein
MHATLLQHLLKGERIQSGFMGLIGPKFSVWVLGAWIGHPQKRLLKNQSGCLTGGPGLLLLKWAA